MVMKRYPNGADGEFFFQKRIPEPHPEWIETCEILHASGNKIRLSDDSGPGRHCCG